MSNHNTRQTLRIIEAAMALIQQEGLSRINMSKVASAAGMTRQTLYNHFSDVESIIVKALDMHGTEVLAQLHEAIEAATGVNAKLCAYAAFYIEAASPEHEAISFEMGLFAKARGQIAEHETAVFCLLENTIAEGLKSGEFVSATGAAVLTDIVQGIVKGGVTSSLRQPTQKPAIVEAVNAAMLAIL